MKQKTIFMSGWVVLLVAVLLLLPMTVLAAFITVNTDDGLIDPSWAGVTPFYTSVGNNPAIPDQFEIKNAWIARSADSSFWYFRTVLYGQLPLDNLSSVEARIDCNNNNSFTDAGDKVVLYYNANPATNDNVIECSGSEYPLCSGPNSEPLKGSDFGEGISVGDGTYSYEWKADTSEVGGMDWSTCNGLVSVQYAVTDSSLTVQDATPWSGFNVPTVVGLVGLNARPASHLMLPALVGLGLVLGAALLWVRSRRRS